MRRVVIGCVGLTACLAAGSLAGCAGGDDHFFSGSGGSGSGLGNLLAFNTTHPEPAPSSAGKKERPLQCPPIEVLDGTASIRTYNGTDQSNDNVRYQYSMGDVARECSKSGDQIAIKVGVEGRVLLGPAGAPGNFSVPIRIAIRRESDQKAAVAKLYQVPASVAPGQTEGAFTLVPDPLTVPFLQANADEDYTILVGFDDHTGPAAPKQPARAKTHGAPAR